MMATKYYLDLPEIQQVFNSLTKAREIAWYVSAFSPRKPIRIVHTVDGGSGWATEGYVGMFDWEHRYWEDRLSNTFNLKRDGSVGEPVKTKIHYQTRKRM